MKNEKQKGGKRKGAGRKPVEVKKEAITIYADISKFGSKDVARMAIYKFLDGELTFIGQTSPIPLAVTSESMSLMRPKPNNKPKTQPPTLSNEDTHFTERAAYDGPKIDEEAIREQIKAIKSEKCPDHRNTPAGKRSWEFDQSKRIKELENQLK